MSRDRMPEANPPSTLPGRSPGAAPPRPRSGLPGAGIPVLAALLALLSALAAPPFAAGQEPGAAGAPGGRADGGDPASNRTVSDENGAEAGIVVREGTPTFEETVDVQLVNVEVFVTDRKGRPIRGLTREDFELRENGEPMEITHFAEATGLTAIGTVEFGKADDGVPGSNAPDRPVFTEASVVAPSYLVVFVDNTHLRPAGRKRTIESLRAFLAKDAIPAERVLIVAQTPDLRTLAPFGSTFEILDSALARLDEMPAHGHEKDRDQRAILDQLYNIYELAQSTPFLSPCEELATQGLKLVDAFSQGVSVQVATSARHLAALASGLAGIPGNKIVLYVSDGLELQPGADLVQQMQEICPGWEREFFSVSTNHDQIERFRQLTRHANANRVSIYTVDARGHRSASTSSIEYEDLRWTPSALVDQVRVANLQGSLSYLAGDTGGRAIFGQTDIRDELQDIAQDMSYFYSLAYSPDHHGDDRVHVIDVRVPGKRKARVRHRMSYRDKPAEERMADRLQTALTLGIEENPLAASLAHGEIRKAGGRDRFEVPLRVTVPLRELVFLPDAENHLGILRLQIAARDAEGRVAAFHQKRFEVQLDASLAGKPEGEHTFVVPLEMRGGEHVVAVGIRDEKGKATSYLASRLVVEPTGARGR